MPPGSPGCRRPAVPRAAGVDLGGTRMVLMPPSGEAMETSTEIPVVVSACLLGLACRYDGLSKGSAAVLIALRGRRVLPVCPEVAAGLGVPRAPFCFAEEGTERVLETRRGLPSAAGEDVAPRLVPACERLADVVLREGVREAILKERSPSCGVHAVHVGTVVRPGEGVFASLLRKGGVAVCSEEDVAVG